MLQQGKGWRVGWDPTAEVFQGLIGSDDWAFELTASELHTFGRLFDRLVASVQEIAPELMPEERIFCEVEGDGLWLGAEGYPYAFGVRVILQLGRQAEGSWSADAIPDLQQALKTLKVF